MDIRKRPYDIDYAGNNPEFILRTTPYLNKGRCRTATFIVNSLPAGTVVFSSLRIGGIPGTSDLVWTVKSNPDDSLGEMQAVPASWGAAAILDSLEAKVVYNPTLRDYFDVKAWVSNGVCRIKFTSLIPEPDAALFYHESVDQAITWDTGVTGAKQTAKHKYRAETFFTVEANGKNFTSPKLHMEDSDGDVRVCCSMAAAYFPKPDIPGANELFEAKACPSATIKTRLWYGEMYADDADSEPTLRTLSRSSLITLFNGKVNQYAADNNFPDWAACNNDHLHLKGGIDILAQDNGDTLIVPPGVEQYIYVYNYSAANMAARIQVAAMFADGTTDDDWVDENLTIVPGVNRIAVKEDDAVAWHVTITEYTFHRTITRHYIVKEHDNGFHTMLLLNALSLYETFIVEDLSREEQTEGDRRIVAGRDRYGTTDRQTVYTAKCHPRNANGLKLLKTAFEKQDNLLLEGNFAWYLDMIPGSLTVSDESADMLDAEFKFRLREKVNRAPQTFNVTSEIDPATKVIANDTLFI